MFGVMRQSVIPDTDEGEITVSDSVYTSFGIINANVL